MAHATDLTDAANIGYSQLSLFWQAATLKNAYTRFIADCQPIFPDATPDNRPVGDWLVLMSSLASQMGAGILPEVQFDTAATYLFRMCLGAAAALAGGRITNAQATAMLAAWNTRFGT